MTDQQKALVERRMQLARQTSAGTMRINVIFRKSEEAEYARAWLKSKRGVSLITVELAQ